MANITTFDSKDLTKVFIRTLYLVDFLCFYAHILYAPLKLEY